MMKYKDKKVLVYGLGRSGQSAIEFLASKNARLYAFDDKKYFSDKAVCLKNFSSVPNKLDFAVISPGVDVNSKNIQTLLANKTQLKSELELGVENYKHKLIGITGTNGKTTTACLLQHIFQVARKKSFLCGNVGEPITSFYSQFKTSKFAVCEISSFQMETTSKLKPYVATILNVLPDHLDRHKNMDNYIVLKEKVVKNAKFKVFNADDEISYNISRKYKDSILFSKRKLTNGAYVDGEYICYKNKKIARKNSSNLLGEKNLENILACVTISKLCGVANHYIEEALQTFKPLAHRLEYVDTFDDVDYINDSKSTNVASTLCALEAFKNRSVILLVGGRSKEFDFSAIFKKKLKAFVCFGECGESLCFGAKNKSVFFENTLKNAFRKAYEIARSGDVVLLSPACASFDEFSSYKERGELFKSLVKRLKTGE